MAPVSIGACPQPPDRTVGTHPEKRMSNRTCSRLTALLMAAAVLFLIPATSPALTLQQALEEQLMSTPADSLGFKWHQIPSNRIDQALAMIYEEMGLKPLWMTPEGPSPRAEVIYRTLGNAGSEGLNPLDYGVEQLSRMWPGRDAKTRAGLDILLTLGLVAYAADVQDGRVQPHEDNPKLFAHAADRELDPLSIVTNALDAPDIGKFMRSLPPTNRHYCFLRHTLARYRRIVKQGGWPHIPSGPLLKVGMQDPRLPIIRRRLAATGDLPDDKGDVTIFDEALSEAVKRFQYRHALEDDGIIGRATLAAMNIPVEKKIEIIELSMERWRWVSNDMGRHYIIVDIAGFILAGIRENEVEIHMPVVVGKQYHETPVFSDAIKYIVFNPYWNIPPSIARREMLPKLRRDRGYLAKENIRLFSGWGANAVELDPMAIDWEKITPRQMNRYKLRQDPGPTNALGYVKFVFPNTYNVYLHDTPSRNLFSRPERAFSHGCIRVSRPRDLAVYVLGGKIQGWDRKRVDEIIASGEHTIVRLKKPLPIHIVYQTVWRDMQGLVHFNRDIYGRDALLAKALFGHRG